jgi:hypothetical protein
VTGKAEIATDTAAAGIEVLDLAEPQPVAEKTQTLEGRMDDVHGTFVRWRDRRPADQVAGEFDGIDDSWLRHSASIRLAVAGEKAFLGREQA